MLKGQSWQIDVSFATAVVAKWPERNSFTSIYKPSKHVSFNCQSGAFHLKEKLKKEKRKLIMFPEQAFQWTMKNWKLKIILSEFFAK